MWGRGILVLIILLLFPLCPSSVHHQLSSHDPQPGLTYSKDTATALLKKHDQPLRVTPKAGFLSRRCQEKMSEENEKRTCLVCPHPSTFSWLVPLMTHVSLGNAWLTKALQDVLHLWPRTRALCAVRQGSRSAGWLWRAAGTPQASCRPLLRCQRSDGTMLGVLKGPQTKVFCIVHVLIQSPVFLLFSVAFGLGHKALNQHSAEPSKSKI